MNMFKKTFNFFQTISPSKYNILNTALAIISVILGVLSLIGFSFQKLKLNNEKAFVFKLADIWNILIIAALAILFVILVVFIIKYRSSIISRMNAASENFLNISRKTSELYDAWEKISSNNREYDCKIVNECNAVIDYKKDLITRHLVDYTIEFLNCVRNWLGCYVGYNISTCIKLVVNKDGDYSNIADKKGAMEYVFTLARDSNSDSQRKEYGSQAVPIEENSDFYDIMNSEGKGSSGFFYVSDLEEYSITLEKITCGQKKYLNSTANWNKYYSGTAVVPIGYTSKVESKEQFRVLAFLCVDSMSKKAFLDKQRIINIRLLRAFAGIYASVLRRYEELSEQIWVRK